MPESAQEEGGEGVQRVAQRRTAVAAEGDIDVVPKPCHQRDVPAAPEVAHGGGEVGSAEILHQLDAEEAGAAHGDVAVAREVAVDLDAEEHGTHGQHQRALLGGRLPDDVHGQGTAVRHQHLLGEAPKHLAQTIDGSFIFKGTRAQHLRQQVRGALDGTSHQLWEEGDVGEEGHGIARGAQLPTMDVDGVAEGLERVERDAHGKDEAQGGQVRVESQRQQ